MFLELMGALGLLHARIYSPTGIRKHQLPEAQILFTISLKLNLTAFFSCFQLTSLQTAEYHLLRKALYFIIIVLLMSTAEIMTNTFSCMESCIMIL